MTTQYFDDGSTLTIDNVTGAVSSTPATDYTFGTGPKFPGGDSLVNALAYGFGRWVDYKTTPQPLQNNSPKLLTPAEQASMQGGTGISISTSALIIGGLLIGGMFMLASD